MSPEYTAVPAAPDETEPPGFFMDYKNGICMTYTFREMKREVCRGCMRVILIALVAGAYVALWQFCDFCILGVAVASCAASCVGCGFMTFNCIAGVMASLLKGFRLGSELANVEIHWKF